MQIKKGVLAILMFLASTPVFPQSLKDLKSDMEEARESKRDIFIEMNIKLNWFVSGKLRLILLIALLYSCSLTEHAYAQRGGRIKYNVSEKKLYEYENKAIDSSLGEFVVNRRGDTLRGNNLKVEYSKIVYPHYVYNGKRLYYDSLLSAQSKDGFWKHYNPVIKELKNPSPSLIKAINTQTIGLELRRIKIGKINAYYAKDDNSKMGIVLNDPKSAFVINRSGSIVTRFFIEKNGDIIEMFFRKEIVRLFEDNAEALAEFVKYFPGEKSGFDISRILEIIDLYNK